MNTNAKTLRCVLVLLAVASVTAIFVINSKVKAEVDWPHDIDVPEGRITMYQPQLEAFEENKLSARAAVSVTPTGQTEPVFGAVWIDADISTDRDTRQVTLKSLKVSRAKFPDAEPDKMEKLKAILEREIPTWDISISLDRLLTMLELVEKEQMALDNMKTESPKIIFSMSPAVLVTIDGEPELASIGESDLQRVVNTPFFMVLAPKDKLWYLKGEENWLKADDLNGSWQRDPNPPESVVAAGKAAEADQIAQSEDGKQLDAMPQIIVSTEPTELIVIDGEPVYSTIYGTDIIYVSNTESDMFVNFKTKEHYILLSGRWYTAASIKGRWSYIAADKLPEDFAKIPAGSEKDNVLAFVAGTDQANDAVA